MRNHSMWRHFLLLGLVVLVLLWFGCPRATAEPEAEPLPAVLPVKARVGMYILNVGKLDLSTSSYTMDFYLTFACDGPCGPLNFEFMNGRPTVDKQDDLPNYKIYRVVGTFSSNLSMRGFPFDKHHLQLVLEDKLRDETTLVYVADPKFEGVDKAVIITGWNLAGECAGTVDGHYYPAWDQTYSRYTFDVDIERPPLSGILKGLLPATIITLSGFLALLMQPDKALQRLGVATSALVGTVLYHLNLTSSVPPVGYITFADGFMIVNYTLLLANLAATAFLVRVVDKKQEELASRIHKWSGILVPAMWAVAQIANFALMPLLYR